MSADRPDLPIVPIDRSVDVPGRGITVVRDIPGPTADAPVVVLLHGLGATGRLNWGPSYRPLSEHFRVVSFDHRGHGKGFRTRRFRLKECADDVAAITEAMGIGKFIAVGYSMGGPIASLTWRRHPDRVNGLVLCATARHFARKEMARGARLFLPLVAGVARLVPGLVHDRMLARMLARIEHPELRDRVHEELAGHDPASVIQAARAVGTYSSHDWIGDVNVPTAVIVTTEDELVPPSRQRKLAASIPGSQVYEVKGDHDACLSVRGEFVPVLVRACLGVVERV